MILNYKIAMRQLLIDKAEPMETPDEPSTYGWQNFDALGHTRTYGGGCTWTLPATAIVTERTLSMFIGTFVDNENEVGVEVTGASCACGKYENVTLRYVGSMQDTLAYLLGVPAGVGGLQI